MAVSENMWSNFEPVKLFLFDRFPLVGERLAEDGQMGDKSYCHFPSSYEQDLHRTQRSRCWQMSSTLTSSFSRKSSLTLTRKQRQRVSKQITRKLLTSRLIVILNEQSKEGGASKTHVRCSGPR